MKDKYKKLKNLVRDRESYAKDVLLVEFINSITALMREKEVTQKELARKLESSEAYVSKVLSGNTNLTLNSLVKFSRALNALPHLHVADKSITVEWVERKVSTDSYAFLIESFVEGFEQSRSSNRWIFGMKSKEGMKEVKTYVDAIDFSQIMGQEIQPFKLTRDVETYTNENEKCYN